MPPEPEGEAIIVAEVSFIFVTLIFVGGADLVVAKMDKDCDEDPAEFCATKLNEY